jgi:1-deoxy-D-xylulose-5-phosphate synthase
MTSPSKYPLLDTIDTPADLRRLAPSQLVPLAEEVRNFMIEAVAQCGGHFGAGLGTVELTVALHYVFETPEDRLVWDVGHQAYPHKILTGRRDRMHTIRKKDGLAPMPSVPVIPAPLSALRSVWRLQRRARAAKGRR